MSGHFFKSQRFLVKIFLFVFLAVPTLLRAQKLDLLEPSQIPAFDLSIGNKIRLSNTATPVTFLGLMTHNHDRKDKVIIFSPPYEVHFYNLDQLQMKPRLKLQKVVTPMDQATNTCSAYALYNFWHQQSLSENSSSTLHQSFSSERERMQFLEKALYGYYVENITDMDRLLNRFERLFQKRCKVSQFATVEEGKKFLSEHDYQSSPLLTEFWIGKQDMFVSPLTYHDVASRTELDPRQWVPRLVGERKRSGHMVVIVQEIKITDKTFLLVLDSNWTQPRLWDKEHFFQAKTAIKDMLFHVCR